MKILNDLTKLWYALRIASIVARGFGPIVEGQDPRHCVTLTVFVGADRQHGEILYWRF